MTITFSSAHLYKSFKNKNVVQDVSIFIKTGEIVGLFGPNGAGKTTCFLMMTGLLKPNKGNIFLNKKDVTYWPLYKKARLGLRYLPQSPSIFRGMTVEENLLAVLEIFESSSSRRYTQLDYLLSEFDLQEVRSYKSSVLSGGERRRVEIARSLIGHPQFLLLDEPLAGIDPKSIDEIGNLLKRLSAQGIGILITDHNVKEMLRIVQRAYIMYHGKIFYEGTPQDILANESVRSLYLGRSFSL
jgi:lipopolysaccharide export system ATP-binding protein